MMIQFSQFLSDSRRLFWVVLLGLLTLLQPTQALALYSGGTGIITDPYLIANVADLQELQLRSQTISFDTFRKYYKQTANINLTGVAWTGIDNFYGNYNGDGYAIQNLSMIKTVSVAGQTYGGFFNIIGGYAAYPETGKVMNLAITGANIQVTSASTNAVNAGILAGQADTATISNVYTTGSIIVSGTATGAPSTAGGLVGYLNKSSINFSYSKASVSFMMDAPSTAYWIYAGGLVGMTGGSTVNNCFSSSGTLSASNSTGGPFAGTFKVGEITGAITNTYATPTRIPSTVTWVRYTGANNMYGYESVPTSPDPPNVISNYSQEAATVFKNAANFLAATPSPGPYFSQDWDFTNIWEIVSGQNDGFPILRLPGPSATTGVASDITATGATLNGTVNDNGIALSAIDFSYGLTTGYGSTVPGTPSSLASGAGSTSVTAGISGLGCNKLYHFRLNGTRTDTSAVVSGSDATFTTSACITGPTVTTNAATGITTTGATLNGSVTDVGANVTSIQFEYGTATGTYGAPVNATPATLTATPGTPQTVNPTYTLSGACNTKYFYRIKATDGSATNNGSELNVITSPCTTGPTVTTNAATSVTGTEATLNGSVTDVGKDVSSIGFEYGLTTVYGLTGTASITSITATPGTPQTKNPTATIAGLTCGGTTYHYRINATDATQTNHGADQTFTTGSCNTAPVASSVTITGTAQVGIILTGSYTYNDAESDPESGSTYQWYRQNDDAGAGRVAISGASGTTTAGTGTLPTTGAIPGYTLTSEDGGKYIVVGVVPKASSGSTPGSEAFSSPTAVPVATTTTLTSTPNPSPVGATVTLTAAVSAAGGTPTGTVAFQDGGTVISGCASQTLSNGVATCATATLTVGSHPLTAQYSGTTAYAASSGTLTQQVLATQANGTSPGGPVSAAITGGTCVGFAANSAHFTAPVNPPVGENFQYGVFGFTVLGCGTTGGTVTITLTYPAALPVGTKYWKQIDGVWADWTNQVTISGNRVTLTLTDGGPGDTNKNPGEISDPSGPALAGGPAVAIPTLSEGAMLLLTVLLFGLAWQERRRFG